MLRFYRQFMEQVFLALVHARDNTGESFDDSQRYTFERWRNMSPGRFPYQRQDHVNLVRFIHETNNFDAWNMTDLIDVIGAQINAQVNQDRPSDKDLIDTIVRLLQLPFARNRFNGETLNNLKTALLLPDEAAGLKEKLQRQEWYCTCGHKFESGEMGTIVSDHRTTVMVCANCTFPTRIACGNGKHSLGVSKAFHKSIIKERGSACELCVVEATPEAPDAEIRIGRDNGGAQPVPMDAPPTPQLRYYAENHNFAGTAATTGTAAQPYRAVAAAPQNAYQDFVNRYNVLANQAQARAGVITDIATNATNGFDPVLDADDDDGDDHDDVPVYYDEDEDDDERGDDD